MNQIKSDSWKEILDSAVCSMFPLKKDINLGTGISMDRANLRTSIHKVIDENRMNSDTYKRTNGKVTGTINYLED